MTRGTGVPEELTTTDREAPPEATSVRRRYVRRLGLLALLILGLVLASMAHRAFDVMVGTPVREVRLAPGIAPSVADPRYRAAIGEIVQRPLVPGNRFELLTTGRETYPALWSDLRAARRTLTFQTYYCEPGEVADSLSRILVERARAGVDVLFLADGFGCRGMANEYRAALEEAGVRVAIFRPLRWYSLHRAQHRSHVRAVVVDGRVGYTGGFGIDDKWFDRARPDLEWREQNVRMTGPVVAQLQAAFAAAWAEATGELLAGEGFFPLLAAEGPHSGALLYTTAGIGSSAAERYLALSIAGARRTLLVTNSYFVPDAEFRRLLGDAARRGVDVRVLTAGPRTDIRTTLLAGRSSYEELLRAGVRIYEYQPTMMHAKSMTVDGAWITVGTTNFDNRSLRLNEESNVIAHDAGLGAALDSVFHVHLRDSKEIRLAEFERRGWWQRLLETGAGLVWFVL